MVTSPDNLVHVALIQMTSSKSLDDNVAFLETHIEHAARAGAHYVLSPENSLLMDLDASRVADITGGQAYRQALDHLFEVARLNKVWLHIGATPVRLEGGDLTNGQSPGLANRSFLIGPDGSVQDTYDKIHMFDVRLPDGEHYWESKNYKSGTRAVVTDCQFAKVGMTICYDLRFATLFRQLAQAGAQMISVPAAFTQYTGKAHWHVLLRARAIETGCFIVASAQTGLHETGRQTYGHSLIVSPWGEVILDAGEACGMFHAELDLAQIEQARAQVPSLQHDKPFDIDASL